jgi:hypothetical protein
MRALLHLAEPAVNVEMRIVVTPGGRASVKDFSVAARDQAAAVTTSTLRRLPVDYLLRTALVLVARATKDRSDIQRDAFQIDGDPEHVAWVSPAPPPSGRGREVPGERIARAAEAYQQALARGSKSPAEDVAAVMGYSRATAARDLRAAREQGLLDKPGGPQPGDPADPLWRHPGAQDSWERLSAEPWSGGPPVQHPGMPTPERTDPEN